MGAVAVAGPLLPAMAGAVAVVVEGAALVCVAVGIGVATGLLIHSLMQAGRTLTFPTAIPAPTPGWSEGTGPLPEQTFPYRLPLPRAVPTFMPNPVPNPVPDPDDKPLECCPMPPQLPTDNNSGPSVLYHYGTRGKIDHIVSTQSIPFSNIAENPDRARYGSGVYFTDLIPGTLTKGQIARRLYGSPHLGNQKHVESWVAIDVSGLPLVYNGPNNYVVHTDQPLPVTGRIVSYGNTP
jgi:hypothetical protein